MRAQIQPAPLISAAACGVYHRVSCFNVALCRRHAHEKAPDSILIATILLAIIFTSLAQAQSDKLIEASVPFNFVIKNRALPAGKYVFSLVQIGGGDAVKIQSEDGCITAFVAVRSVAASASNTEPKLVFNRYADQYFLSQVCGLEESAKQQLARTRDEQRLAENPTRRRAVSVAARKR